VSGAGKRVARRRGAVGLVLVAVVALMVGASATLASGQVKVGPTVPAAGVGTQAALNSPTCDKSDGKLAYPYQQRAPCVRPMKKGENNGGATAEGVTKDAIKVVLVVGTHDQQNAINNMPGATPPKNYATGGNAWVEDTFTDWQKVFDQSFNTWGRKMDFVVFNPSGADEASQRADAVSVIAMKPFMVIDTAGTAGGGDVFDTAVAAAKIMVIGGAGTNQEARKQSGYRWINGADADSAAVNGGEWIAKEIYGQTAKWAGDSSMHSKTRVLGAVFPSSGVETNLFLQSLKKYGGKLDTSVTYTVPTDSSTQQAVAQQEAPTLMAKLKAAGVTSVVLFSVGSPTAVIPSLLSAATDLNYYPEWIYAGGFVDVDLVARLFDQKQWAHAFGIGTLPLYVANLTGDPQSAWFQWYWGTHQGNYSPATAGFLYTLNAGVMLAGPKLSPATFKQGLFAMPANGGAATNQLQSFMFGYGRTSGLPYDEFTNVGLDFAVNWYNPNNVGPGKITFTNGTGRYMYPNGAKRYHAGQWPKGEPDLFNPNTSIAQFDTLPQSDVVPTYPCKGCPSQSG
jgi:hypothetical protein